MQLCYGAATAVVAVVGGHCLLTTGKTKKKYIYIYICIYIYIHICGEHILANCFAMNTYGTAYVPIFSVAGLSPLGPGIAASWVHIPYG